MGENQSSSNGEKRGPMRLDNNHNNSAIIGGSNDDRLSSLPDSLLVDILSLLDIKVAAATSALSPRWRHLWTQVTSLRLEYLESETVKHILGQLTSPKIQLLQLSIDRKDDIRLQLDSCFNHIRHRNVEHIWVYIHSIFYTIILIKVPHWILKCPSLVSLEFCDSLQFDDDKLVDCVNLPNLKVLQLCLSYDNENFLRKLLKSCPLLEYLYLTLVIREDGHFVDISCPNLQCLYINNKRQSRSKFVINAPRLLYLTVIDFHDSHFSFVEYPVTLVQASIQLMPNWGSRNLEEEHAENGLPGLSKLIQEVSGVTKLYLGGFSKTISFLGSLNDEVVPIFNNLTYLWMGDSRDHCSWRDMLSSLRCFPKLENLEVFINTKGQEDWDAFAALPPTLLSNLKSLNIEYGTIYEIKPLEYILGNASAMNQLVLHADNCNMDELFERDFCWTLFELPRSFLACEIQFYGCRYTASSNELRADFLMPVNAASHGKN